jgi:hypothetical protein
MGQVRITDMNPLCQGGRIDKAQHVLLLYIQNIITQRPTPRRSHHCFILVWQTLKVLFVAIARVNPRAEGGKGVGGCGRDGQVASTSALPSSPRRRLARKRSLLRDVHDTVDAESKNQWHRSHGIWYRSRIIDYHSRTAGGYCMAATVLRARTSPL